ncbi:MAG: PEP-CTERM sorting domain-containing protein, partial [Pirellulaceae bacterium]|nr:PEP-CTERM sorting domain-containing protein [Pirellulaceae bacterium]
ADHWGQAGDWSMGDFNDDGVVNALDAAILAAHWGHVAVAEQSDPATAVPEPSALVILLGGLLALVARRGSKRRVR